MYKPVRYQQPGRGEGIQPPCRYNIVFGKTVVVALLWKKKNSEGGTNESGRGKRIGKKARKTKRERKREKKKRPLA